MNIIFAFAVLSAAPSPELDARFQRTSGWLGADGNYSVTISKDRTLWFFSDTWLGDLDNGKRRHAKLINNSVGVMAAKGPVEFAWGKGDTAFFQPEDRIGWLWPFAGTVAAGKVHLFLWQMEKAKGPAAFAFRVVAVWHAVIENPNDEPAKWKIKQMKLPCSEITEKQNILFGSSICIFEKHAYIYGVLEKPNEPLFGKKMVLARVSLEEIGEFSHWRFRTADGWSEDFRKVEPLAAGMASEYSVTRLQDRFVAVTNDAFLSPKIVARSAPQPWGPWSEPVLLFTCQEAKEKKDVFCYSGKAHAGLSTNDELVLSYAANSHKFADVLNDANLYWPRFVTVKLAKR